LPGKPTLTIKKLGIILVVLLLQLIPSVLIP